MAFIDEIMGLASPESAVGGVTNSLRSVPNAVPPPDRAPPMGSDKMYHRPGSRPGTPAYDSKSPPPGFTSEQWIRLLKMAKNDPKIAELIKKYTATAGQPSEEDKWRREMPTDTSQLLKQLSYNAGEMGMPGGYVGAIQLPAYGSTQAPVNNPDMSKYGQADGIGEATFYQQSMKGGMAPIAAMSPLGVPEGWKPGETSIKDQLDDYLNKINSGGSGGGSGGSGSNPYAGMNPESVVQRMLDGYSKAKMQGVKGFPPLTFMGLGFMQAMRGKKAANNAEPPVTNDKPPYVPGDKPGSGIPISRPFGFSKR